MAQKILVIDDSPTVQTIIRSTLKDEGVEVSAALNGTEGFRKAIADLPDLILLDVEMPPPNGFETCRQLKSDPATVSIPVIFLTGASSTAEKVKGLDLGAVDYVIKPFDPAELCARVRASLRNKFMFDLLAQRAMIDGLTGLWNRAYLDERLAAEAALARRHHRPLSAIMADVDRFKLINDAHGHPFGDDVLRRVAQALSSCCRTEDIVCRYGGEEFAILTPGVSISGAEVLAERARQIIHEQTLRHRSADVRVSCSLGVAELSPDGPLNVLEVADGALYQAKRGGRNRVIAAGVSKNGGIVVPIPA